MRIRLSLAEAALVTRLKLWPEDVMSRFVRDRDAVNVEITSHEAAELLERCAAELALRGFDRDYKPTEDGRLLEDLIDKVNVD